MAHVGAVTIVDQGSSSARGLLTRIVLLALLYLVAGRLGLLLSAPHGHASAIWPASGIAVVALRLYGPGLWPGVLAGAFLVHLGAPPWGPAFAVAASVAAGATIQALLAWRLVDAVWRRDPGLLERRSVLAFCALAGPVACVASSGWGTLTLWAAGTVPAVDLGYTWATWWAGDTVGVLVAGPLALAWAGEPRSLWVRRRVSLTVSLVTTLTLAILFLLSVRAVERYGVELSLELGGRDYRVEFAAMPGTGRGWSTWALLASGAGLTGLLGVAILLATRRSTLDERRVAELGSLNAALSGEITQRQGTERALQREKERAEVTLHSIGDAVITTDAEALVEFLNPVAERLTGWSNAECRGRPLSSVFNVVNEDTREPPADPIARCIAEGRIVGLANQTVLISRSGREFAIQDSAAPIRTRDGHIIGVVLVFNDVTEMRRLAREAAHHASHDALTGLVNRREFDQRLARALASGKRYGTRHVLCYVDLDQFKIVNDTSGHRAGDELLKLIANVLAREVRERDTVARLGGDEFGLLLDNCPLDKALEIAEGLVRAVRDFRFDWEGRTFELGASLGLVAITGAASNAEELLGQADNACYAAKNLGRNRVQIYRHEDGTES